MTVAGDLERALLARVPTDLFIDGKWTPATGGATFDVLDPATGKLTPRLLVPGVPKVAQSRTPLAA